jgi:hypothetical protein
LNELPNDLLTLRLTAPSQSCDWISLLQPFYIPGDVSQAETEVFRKL